MNNSIHDLDTQTAVYLYLHTPQSSRSWHELPSAGVGLLRIGWIMRTEVGVHPLAALELGRVDGRDERRRITELAGEYRTASDFVVDTLVRRIVRIANAYHPRPVIVSFSDLTSAQYAELTGGTSFEPAERRPCLGARGAMRYLSDWYRPAFELECRALYMVRECFGAHNVAALVPFCRTPEEADAVLDIMVKEGLHRGQEGFRVYLSAELPANATCAAEFAQRFDGLVVDPHALGALTLGVDASSPAMQPIDVQDRAICQQVEELAAAADAAGIPLSACGPALLEPGIIELLLRVGVDSVIVPPELFAPVRERLAIQQQQRPGIGKPSTQHQPQAHAQPCCKRAMPVTLH